MDRFRSSNVNFTRNKSRMEEKGRTLIRKNIRLIEPKFSYIEQIICLVYGWLKFWSIQLKNLFHATKGSFFG